jgi:hypothetical protein
MNLFQFSSIPFQGYPRTITENNKKPNVSAPQQPYFAKKDNKKSLFKVAGVVGFSVTLGLLMGTLTHRISAKRIISTLKYVINTEEQITALLQDLKKRDLETVTFFKDSLGQEDLLKLTAFIRQWEDYSKNWFGWLGKEPEQLKLSNTLAEPILNQEKPPAKERAFEGFVCGIVISSLFFPFGLTNTQKNTPVTVSTDSMANKTK